MTEWLCRRYLRTPDNQILQLSEDEIDQCCQKELAFLECLAFNAMENNTIIIRSSLLKKALKEAQVSLKEHPHTLNIGILKSFNKQGTGTQIEINKDHYFVHLSFQEYFAARYLTSALKGCSTEKAIEFIKHQKYNQRYALVFTFTSGILSEIGAEFGIHIFWNTILGEPLDLVGVRHIQLIISCFEAAYGKSTLPRRTQLLQWIANCIQYNVSNGNKIILKHLSQSLERAQLVLCDPTILNVLINLLECSETHTKANVFSFLSALNISNPSIALINSIVTTLTGKNSTVSVNACQALLKMGEKAATNEVISKLVSTLGDESETVRRNACEALEKMGEKAATNEVISKLVSALGDESEDVRGRACAALGKMGEKAATNEVISKLASALGDESANVRESACYSLGKMGEKAATNEVMNNLVVLMNDKRYFVYTKAASAIKNIFSSSAILTQLDPKLISDLFLSERGFDCLRNVSLDQLVVSLLTPKKLEWSSVATLFAIRDGVAVTHIEGKFVVYDRKEPSDPFVPTLELRQQLIQDFIDQAKRWHLDFSCHAKLETNP